MEICGTPSIWRNGRKNMCEIDAAIDAARTQAKEGGA